MPGPHRRLEAGRMSMLHDNMCRQRGVPMKAVGEMLLPASGHNNKLGLI